MDDAAAPAAILFFLCAATGDLIPGCWPALPLTRGVAPFKENDGFIYKLKFVDDLKGITPLLRTTPPKGTLKAPRHRQLGVPASRFGPFVRVHRLPSPLSWGLESMRRFVTNGILWSAGLEVPAGGAPVAFDPADLKLHLDPSRRRK